MSSVCCRATIVGEQSFGKGLVQYYFPCFEDGGLKLTIAKYLTPNRCEFLSIPSHTPC